jgi:microcystin-dependent protein/prefoldin subunit 5
MGNLTSNTNNTSSPWNFDKFSITQGSDGYSTLIQDDYSKTPEYIDSNPEYKPGNFLKINSWGDIDTYGQIRAQYIDSKEQISSNSVCLNNPTDQTKICLDYDKLNTLLNDVVSLKTNFYDNNSNVKYYNKTETDNLFKNYYNKTGANDMFYSKTGANDIFYSKTGANNLFATQTGLSGVNARFVNYYDMTSANDIFYSKTGANNLFATQTGLSGVNARFVNYYDKTGANDLFATKSAMSGVNTSLSASITGINSSITSINASITGINSSITGINNSITNLSTSITGVSNNLNTINTNLSASITGVSNNLTTINTNLSASITGVSNNLTTINTNLSASITGINSSITSINSSITGINDSITSINSSITGINTNLSNNYYNRNTIKNMLNNSVPVGTIIPFAGKTLPSGFLLCNGAPYDKSGKYNKLFNVIGITYGGTTTSTTFNVPDIANRTIVGGATGATDRAIGSKSGSETAKLTIPNLPAHSHTYTMGATGTHTHPNSTMSSTGAHTHAGSTTSNTGAHTHAGSTTSSTGAHDHGVDIFAQGAYYSYVYGTSGGYKNTQKTSQNGDHTHGLTIKSDGNHTHNLSITQDGSHTHNLTITDGGLHSHTLTINDTGSGTSFNIMNPYITIFYIIKFDDPSNVTEPTIVTENYTHTSSVRNHTKTNYASMENYTHTSSVRNHTKSNYASMENYTRKNYSSEYFGVF